MGVNGVLKEVQWVFEGSFKGVVRIFSRKFQRCFKEVKLSPMISFRVIQGRFKGI